MAMKEFVKETMGKMMSGMMKPEDMLPMMDKMFSEMTAEDKMQFRQYDA